MGGGLTPALSCGGAPQGGAVLLTLRYLMLGYSPTTPQFAPVGFNTKLGGQGRRKPPESGEHRPYRERQFDPERRAHARLQH